MRKSGARRRVAFVSCTVSPRCGRRRVLRLVVSRSPSAPAARPDGHALRRAPQWAGMLPDALGVPQRRKPCDRCQPLPLHPGRSRKENLVDPATATVCCVDPNHLRVAPGVSIGERELQWRTTRSGGPGGQHANTADTRVEVSFDVRRSPSLTPRERALVMERIGPVVRAVASDTRSQARNRDLARARLVSRLGAALRTSRTRRPTRATRSSRESRLQTKQQRATTKALRRRPRPDDE